MEYYGYIVAIIASWVIAHTIKYIVSKTQHKERSFREQLFMSGGMPSSHSAIVVSVAVLIALHEGVGSPMFGVALALALIVIYDAAHVRLMAGQTADLLHSQLRVADPKVVLPRISQGHTSVEVLAGAVLGGIIALVVFLATK